MTASLSTVLRRLAEDRNGTIGIVFAVAVVPLLIAVGAAVDYTRAASEQTRLQNALDMAALAALSASTPATTADEARARLEEHLKADYGLDYKLTSFEAALSRTDGDRYVKATATVRSPTSFLGLAGIPDVPVAAASETRIGNDEIEIVMVLDNSGSMTANNRIARLRDAAGSLVDTVEATAHGTVRYALVPFAALVNVGPAHAAATWIDTSGTAPSHSTNFNVGVNRLLLYSKMKSVSWRGCVEARTGGHDVTDAVPTPADKATYFVPSFAPDEPDFSTNKSFSYMNNYLTDDVGSGCTTLSGSAGDQTRQRNGCKYNGTTPKTALVAGTRYGPNMMCDSAAIQPLTSDTAVIDAAIGGMTAYGGTNITEGLAWGWRAISPGEPFTEGKLYDAKGVRKVIVLMTDGENTLNAQTNINRSTYSAYGYVAEGRLGITTGTTSVIQDKMDARLATLCGGVKAAGIEVYTITYDVSDTATRTLMGACASSTGHAYFPSASDSLTAVFEAIGKSVGKIRLSQ
ncbi:TadE/TadG family type IV pilus assembly protein [Chthonobacter rhizosphaerae]|uniref:TadE/TadG family type IV pilus assembly protein n=1 Tax=Chthonobacter rhizosphaerae TaxID=2735553 RepID=UPI0015EF4A0F|nr:TadE/TadG family type IV pilus assembly protein [Chthonobacter rhizosphaerae]